jgi:hypothetical protein
MCMTNRRVVQQNLPNVAAELPGLAPFFDGMTLEGIFNFCIILQINSVLLYD